MIGGFIQESKSKNAMVAVVAIVALIVGGVGGYVAKDQMNNDGGSSSVTSSQPTTDTKVADLRVLLSGLQQEHVSLASAATRAGFDGTRNFEVADSSLGENTDDLSAAVGSVYGEAAKAKFKEI